MFTFTCHKNLEIPVPQASFGMSHDIICQEEIHKNCDIDIDICYINPCINYIKLDIERLVVKKSHGCKIRFANLTFLTDLLELPT